MKIYKISDVQEEFGFVQDPTKMQAVEEAVANLQIGLVNVNDMVQRIGVGLKDAIVAVLEGNATEVVLSGNANLFSGADLDQLSQALSSMVASMGVVNTSLETIKANAPDSAQVIIGILQNTKAANFTADMPEFQAALQQMTGVTQG